MKSRFNPHWGTNPSKEWT